MNSKVENRISWILGVGLVSAIMMMAGGLMAQGRPLGLEKAGLLLLGVGMGLLLFIPISEMESKRFQREMEQAKNQSTPKPIRLPLSSRTVDLLAFRRMWGADYPENWKREEDK